MNGNYMTREEVASLFGVTKTTVGNWAERGLLKRVMLSDTTKRGVITVASVKKLQEDFEDIALCEQRIKEYKSELQKEQLQLANELKDISERRNIFQNTDMLLTLIKETYLMLARENVSERDSQIVAEALSGVPYGELVEKYSITRERIRQILSHAHEVMKNTPPLRTLMEQNRNLRKKIKELQAITSVVKQSEEEKANGKMRILSKEIIETTLPTRIKNSLIFQGFHDIKDVVLAEKDKLYKAKNLGRKSIYDLEEYLEGYGLHLGMKTDEILSL